VFAFVILTFFKKDALKLYHKSLGFNDLLFLCAIGGHLMNIPTKNELENYVNAYFTVLCARRNDDMRYIDALRYIRTSATELERLQKEFAKVKVAEAAFETEESAEQGSTDHEQNTLFASSPFYLHFKKKLDEIIASQDESQYVNNRFYNPKYAEDFLAKNLSYLPLWSRLFVEYGSQEFKRPNNGAVEGYFGGLKNMLSARVSLGNVGSIKIGRYVRELKEANESELRIYKQGQPDHHTSRSSKRTRAPINVQRTHSLPPEIQLERWKGKTKTSTGIFASTSIMKASVGKFLMQNGKSD